MKAPPLVSPKRDFDDRPLPRRSLDALPFSPSLPSSSSSSSSSSPPSSSSSSAFFSSRAAPNAR